MLAPVVECFVMTSIASLEKTKDNMNHFNPKPNQVNRVKLALCATFAAVILSGCSVSSGSSIVADENKLVQSSVTKTVAAEGVASTDAELIKSVVADAPAGETSKLLAWSNPETGSKGTITAINKYTGSHGQKCKKFQTTVQTFMGISLYNGETCELRKGFWVLSWFLREGA